MLAPATRLMWRSPRSVHLELGGHAVVVEGLPVPAVRRFASARPPAGPAPVDDESRQALTALAEAGYLWSRPDEPSDDPRVAPPNPRLAGELTALSARHGPGAAEVLNSRRHATVQVCGPGRAAAHIAAVLAAAGVGRVHCSMTGTARLHHAVPGGIVPADEGRGLASAAEAAVAARRPGTATAPVSADDRPDLTVLVLDVPVPEERRQALHAAAAAHLAVDLRVDAGVIGPLVLPGLTSCLRCADLHRRDRDPAWPALAVQLTIGRRYGPASDVAMASVVAGVAALQALAFLDGGEPAVIDATVELHLPTGGCADAPDRRTRNATAWPRDAVIATPGHHRKPLVSKEQRCVRIDTVAPARRPLNVTSLA